MQNGFGGIVAIIAIVVLSTIAAGVYYVQKSTYYDLPSEQRPDKLIAQTPQKDKTFSNLTTVSTITPKDLTISDGGVYRVDAIGRKILLVDKRDFGRYGDDYFKFTDIYSSPDESKIILIADAGLTLMEYYYTPLDKIDVKKIGVAEFTEWSNNSRYIAYISKPGDAGPLTVLGIYDTNTDSELKINNKPKIGNLEYDYLGFDTFEWLTDDSAIRVKYQAFKYKGKDADPQIETWGAVVGKGEFDIPLPAGS